MLAVSSLPGFPGPRDDNVETRNHHDETIVQSPGPVCVFWNACQRPVGIVPPQKPVVVRGVALLRGIPFGQTDNLRHRCACSVHKALRNDLVPVPFAASEIQVTDAGHGIHVRADARAKLPPRDAVNFGRPIRVFAPDQIVARDSQRRKHTLEHQLVHVLLIRQRDALRQPVRPRVAVKPFRARLKEEFPVTARLLKSGRLRREMQDRDFPGPAGLRVALRRRSEGWVVLYCLIGQRHLAVHHRQTQRRHPD